MDEKELAADGGAVDAGCHNYAQSDDSRRFAEASDELSKLNVPKFLRAGYPLDRLIFVAFDGIVDGKHIDIEHATNVAKINDEMIALSRRDSRIFVVYVEGLSVTEDQIQRGLDSATEMSFLCHIERVYKALIEKANAWSAEQPGAKISVQTIGFRLGANQAAAFANIFHDRGIPDILSFV